MKSIFTILICCVTFIGYSQSKIILMPEFNFKKSLEKKNNLYSHSDGVVNLSLKGGYKVIPCFYVGPYLGFETYSYRTLTNGKNTETYFKSGVFIGYFQKNFQEKKFSFNIICQFLYEKSYTNFLKLNSVSHSHNKNYRIDLIPSLYIKCTSYFGINLGTSIYCILPKTATPIKIKNYGLHPNIGFIISI